MTDSAVSQLPQHQEGAQFFCNIDLIKRAHEAFAPSKACLFHALRRSICQLITSQTMSNALITRNILVTGPESMDGSTWLVSSTDDIAKQNYYLAEDFDPDNYILKEALRLRNTDIILITDKLPDKTWWRSAQSRKLNVIIIRSARVESHITRDLLDCGASMVFALPSVKSWAIRAEGSKAKIAPLVPSCTPYTEQTFASAPDKIIVDLHTPIELSDPVKKFIPAAPRERVLLVIDEANFKETAKRHLALQPDRVRINYQALTSYLSNKGDREIVAKYVTLRETKDGERAPLVACLEEFGFTVIAPVAKLHTGNDWDDLQIRYNLPHWVAAHQATTVILVSGDGGYTGTLDSLRHSGVRVEIVSTLADTNPRLLDFDRYIDLTSDDVPNILLNQTQKKSGGKSMANGWVGNAYQWLRNNFDHQGPTDNCSGEIKLRWQLLLNSDELQIIASFVSWQDRDRGTDGAWINSFVGTRIAQGQAITPQQVERMREDALLKLGYIWNEVDHRATNKYYEANKEFQRIMGEMLALHEPTIKLNEKIQQLTDQLAESRQNEAQAIELARHEEARANTLASEPSGAPSQTQSDLVGKIIARDREMDTRMIELNAQIDALMTEQRSLLAMVELNKARTEEKLAPLYQQIAEAAQSRQTVRLFELYDELQTEMESIEQSSSQTERTARLEEIEQQLEQLRSVHAVTAMYRQTLAGALQRYEDLVATATALIETDPATEVREDSSQNLPAIYEPIAEPSLS